MQFLFALLCARKHEFDSVFLIDLGRARVVIHRDDIRLRVHLADFRIMPLPAMWFGRQPNGWVQTMLVTPSLISSTISAGSSQPSPILTP